MIIIPTNVKNAMDIARNEPNNERERLIMDMFDSFEYTNGGRTANIYAHDGHGFQVVVEAWGSHKVGDITN